MFVVDIKREHNAVAEARKLKVPIIAVVDTNCDPDLVTFHIAANDDAIRSVRTILATIGQTITLAQAEFESKRSRRAAEETAAEAAEVPAVPAAPVAPAEPVPQPTA
jgi:small subunit ribosomal protein S2